MQNNTYTNTKRLAKNTIYLYFRMVLSLLVTFFASRIVLNILGVSDYGLYNVVCGIITMFSFLNISMSAATSRFITYEMALDKKENIQEVFSAALTIHFIIALIIFIISETIGLWFLNYQLVIDEDRMIAANWIYQFSILTMIIQIIQVPYVASIMANEKMDIYAIIEITQVLFKLGIVFVLIILPFDKLIIYGVLLFSVSLLVSLCYQIYCVKKLKGCRFFFSSNKTRIYPMLKFSGWDLYGNASVVARNQGVNIILNIFFGTILNAASAISTQVYSAINQLSTSVNIAIRPQIIKSYANNDINRMITLIEKSASYTTLLLMIFIIPLVLNMDFVLKIWLGDIAPLHASILCKITLLTLIFTNLGAGIGTAIHATGNIKRISFITGTIYLIVIPITYILFKLKFMPEIAFIINAITSFLSLIINAHILSLYIKKFRAIHFLYKILIKTFGIGLFIFFIIKFLSNQVNFESDALKLIFSILMSFTLILNLTYFFILDKKEKLFCENKVRIFLSYIISLKNQ